MTAIFLSANEIRSLARKAATGAGLAYGIAEDLSAACAFLALNNVDAIAALLPGLEQSDHARAAIDGLSAIDRLVAGDAPDGLTLDDIDAPLLFAGLAAQAAEHLGLSIRLTLDDHHIDLPGPLDTVPVSGPATIHLRLIDDHPSASISHPRPAPTDANAVAAAEKLAARTYVPASDQSRRGAGASATDND